MTTSAVFLLDNRLGTRHNLQRNCYRRQSNELGKYCDFLYYYGVLNPVRNGNLFCYLKGYKILCNLIAYYFF